MLDDEEVEPLNDLSTADDDSSGYFVPKTNTDEGTVGVKIKFPFRLRCTVNGPTTAT